MGSDTCSRPPLRQGCPTGAGGGVGGRPSLVPRLDFYCLSVRVLPWFFCSFYFFLCFFPPPLSVCVCLWPAGPPLPCSSASSTPRSQSPSPLPSPPPNEGPGRSLGDGAARAAAGSDSEEEFVPQSFLVQSGSGNLCVAANGEWLSLALSFSLSLCLLFHARLDSCARGCRLVGGAGVLFGLVWGFYLKS